VNHIQRGSNVVTDQHVGLNRVGKTKASQCLAQGCPHFIILMPALVSWGYPNLINKPCWSASVNLELRGWVFDHTGSVPPPQMGGKTRTLEEAVRESALDLITTGLPDLRSGILVGATSRLTQAPQTTASPASEASGEATCLLLDHTVHLNLDVCQAVINGRKIHSVLRLHSSRKTSPLGNESRRPSIINNFSPNLQHSSMNTDLTVQILLNLLS
jgi:hypothetical protein